VTKDWFHLGASYRRMRCNAVLHGSYNSITEEVMWYGVLARLVCYEKIVAPHSRRQSWRPISQARALHRALAGLVEE